MIPLCIRQLADDGDGTSHAVVNCVDAKYNKNENNNEFQRLQNIASIHTVTIAPEYFAMGLNERNEEDF
jgi:hypothetical protein